MLSDARVALVTRAGSPAGQAVAQRLALDAFRLALSDCRAEAAAAAARYVRAAGTEAEPLTADPSIWTAMQAVVQCVLDRWSRLDLIVNIQGDHGPGSLLELTEDSFDASFDEELVGLVHGVRAAAEPMRAATSGCIVNVFAHNDASMAADAARAGATDMLTRAAAVELAPHGVRVVGIGAKHLDEQREAVADAVAFVASPDATYMTGTTLRIADNRPV